MGKPWQSAARSNSANERLGKTLQQHSPGSAAYWPGAGVYNFADWGDLGRPCKTAAAARLKSVCAADSVRYWIQKRKWAERNLTARINWQQKKKKEQKRNEKKVGAPGQGQASLRWVGRLAVHEVKRLDCEYPRVSHCMPPAQESAAVWAMAVGPAARGHGLHVWCQQIPSYMYLVLVVAPAISPLGGFL